MNRLKYHSCEI